MRRIALALCCLLSASAGAPSSAAPASRQSGRAEAALAGALRAGAPPEAVDSVRAMLAPGDDDEHSAYVVPVGDLDGDGLADLLDVRDHGVPEDRLDGWTVYHYTTTVDARRGRDGALLWTRTFAADERVFPVPARVGSDGRAGILFAVYGELGQDADAIVAGAGAYTDGLTLLAVDARTGQQVWSRSLAGAGGWGYTIAAWVADTYGYAVLRDVADLVAGPASDLLVGVVGVGSGETGSARAHHLVLVSGADGSVTDTRASATQADGYSDAQALPDVSGDGLADFAVFGGGYDDPTVSLTAYRGSDGSVLWSSSATALDGVSTADVGDLTGDGVADLGIVAGWYGDEITTDVLDARTGKRLFSRPGYPALLGRGEVALMRVGTRGVASVEAGVYDGAGRRRWSVTRALSGSDKDLESRGISGIGDVTGDGVGDLGYVLAVTPRGAAGRRDEGWIDGRTGRVHRDPAPDVRILRTPVDGRGTDFLARTLTRGALSATTYAGSTGSLLWRSKVRVPTEYDFVSASGSLLASSRRCADVYLTLAGDSPLIQTVLFRADGTPAWSLTRDGGPTKPVLGHPAILSRTSRNGCR